MKNWFTLEKFQGWRRKYKKLVNIIAVLVVFATTYALILPAITLDQEKAEQTAGIETQETPAITETSQLPETTVLAPQAPSVDSSAEEVQTQVNPATEAVPVTEVQVTTEEASEPETDQDKIVEPTTMVHKTNDYELTATFDASAQLPKGVELVVRELNSQSQEYKTHYEKTKEKLGVKNLVYARFFDIHFAYEGQEVEPAAPIKITIQNNQAIKLKDESQLKVVHFENSQEVEVVKAETKESNNQISEVSFQAQSFSIYGDVAADYYDVKFVMVDSDNVEQEIVTLIDISEGATIKDLPDEPFRSGYTFKHWIDRKTGSIVTADTPVTEDMVVEAVFEPISIYTIKVNYFYQNKSSNQKVVFDSETFQLDDDDVPYRITPPASTKVYRSDDSSLAADAVYYPEQPLIEITADQVQALANQEDKTITIDLQFVPYTAEYDFVYLLKDLTGDGYTEIEKVHAYGLLGSTVTAQVLDYDFAHFEKTSPVEITQKTGQELKVYYTRKSYTLSYQPNGGSYVDPQTGLYKEKVAISSEIPKREGYDFVGWYDNKELTGNPVTGSVELNGDQTLYAKWEPKTVAYRVVYFEEVYNNDTNSTNYVYRTTIDKTGKVGTTAQANSADSIATSLPHHEPDTAANAKSSVLIQPDGSSVLNVYYKLKRYTLRFELGTTSNATYDRYLRLTMNGQTYTKSSGSLYEIKNVVLGQYIAPIWPSGSNEIFETTGYYGFSGWYNSNNPYGALYLTDRDKMTEDLLNGANSNNVKVFTAIWNTNLIAKRVEYYLQSANNASVYELSPLSQDYRSQRNSTLNPKTIEGFTYSRAEYEYDSSRTIVKYRFYYTRNTFTIDYFYKDSLIRTTGKTVRFDQDINTSTYNYIPPRPATVDSDYTWGGWYSDANLRSKYTFGVMPPNNLALYANWVAPSYPVTFDLNGASGTPPQTQSVEKYKTATLPDEPSRDYYDFVGWYTHPTGGSYYDWSKPVTGPVTLYAQWKLKPLTYTVKYLEVGSNKPLATEKVVTSPAFELNQAISEDALAITGYRPDSRSKEIKLDYANNEIIFYYAKKTADITYTIKYVLATNPAIEVAPLVTKTVPGSTIRVKETAVKVDKNHFASQANVTADMLSKDYYPIVNLKTLTLSSNDANNVIVFEYRDFDTAKITVNYLDMDGNPIPGQNPTIAYRKKTNSYLVNRPSIAGYTYEKSLDNKGVANKQVYRITDTNDIVIDLYYKKNLMITAQNQTKVYDGQVLENSSVADVTSDYQAYLESGDSLETIVFEGSQTDVGSSTSSPKDAVIKAGNQDRNYFYNIQYVPGLLRVTPQPVSIYIEGDSAEKVYDGQTATIGYSIKKIEDSSQLYKESDIAFAGSEEDKTISKKDAGDYVLNLQNKFINSNPNFSVNFYVSNGKLTIGKRLLTITSDSASKDYDGSELRADNITVSAPAGVDYTGFVDGEGLVPTFLGGPIDPGMMPNYFDYAPKDGTNLANYELDIQFGQLKVKEVIKIQKTDLAWQALSGGKFELTKWDGLNWAQVDGAQEFAITSEDGIRIPVGLEAGRYRLKELSAPDGFIVLDSYIYFSIKETFNEDKTASFYTVTLSDEVGNDASPERAKLTKSSGDASHRIQVANEQGRALPSTGGDGQKWFILSGLSLMLVSYLTNSYIRKKRERRGQSST